MWFVSPEGAATIVNKPASMPHHSQNGRLPRLAPSADPVRGLQSDLALRRALELKAAGQIGDAALLCGDILKQNPAHAGTLYLMGTLAHLTGAIAVAIGSLERAAAAAPQSSEVLTALGSALAAGNRHKEALAVMKRAVALRPNSSAAYRGLGQVQLDLGRTLSALRSFERALRFQPNDQQAAYFVAALSGKEATGLGAGYVPALFDSYAERFDEHLTEGLGYGLPEIIHDGLARHVTRGLVASAIDLGCGTGLVGTAIRNQVMTIDGIDISEQMVSKARQRDVYRLLAAGDATRLLRTAPAFAGPYDLVTAADVLIYIGRLENLFAAVSERLSRGGLFVFSVESDERAEVVIRSTGRFGHSVGYIAGLVDAYQFMIEEQKAVTIRQEMETAVAGVLYTLRKR